MASLPESHLMTFYVTQFHAQRPPGVIDVSCIKDEEINHNRRSIFSWFPVIVLKQFNIGWLARKEHYVEDRGRLIVFSGSGEYIAVLFNNEVTILRKDDNFTKSFQTFTAFPESRVLLHGVWVDHWNILVVSDNSNTIYFLKSNEDLLENISNCHLQASGTIVGLFVWKDRRAKISDRYSIMVITSDCSFQWIALNEKNSALNPLNSKATQQFKLRRQHPLGISCSCFHKESSMLVVAGPTKAGLYSLSVWRLTNTSDIELICSNSELKGVLNFPKKYSGPFSAPKVVVSSCASHLAMLDLTGNLHILTLEGNPHSVCEISLSDDKCMEMCDEGWNTVSLDGIIDVAWWSKGKLMVAKSNGIVNLIEIASANNVLEDIPRFSSPVLARNPTSQGQVFLLESIFPHQSEDSCGSLHEVIFDNVQHGAKISHSTSFELKNRGSGWKLLSLLEQSVPEMYRILIDGKKYEAAHHFATKHGLNEDEVLKSQWLHSDYGKEAVQFFLSNIHDRSWVLSECVDKIGSTVDSVQALLSYGLSETEDYRFQEIQNADYNIVWQFRLRRLRLLQYIDRLETFLGVNMGRFSSQEYAIFRKRHLDEIAINLAESGKLGALNLLFKRHTFSLAPSILRILDAVPETIPVPNYSQLLPGLPKIEPTGRDEDWVENEEVMAFIDSHWKDRSEEIDLRMSTEHMVKLCSGLLWPSTVEVIQWYKERARTIDKLSGQLENSLFLLDIGYHHKGFIELRSFFDDVSDLCHLVFSGGDMADRDLDLSLSAWEHLCDYEKFNALLNGVTEATAVERLRELAVPFMHRKYGTRGTPEEGDSSRNQLVKSIDCSETFLVKWLKDRAKDNNLELCSVILEEGCKDSEVIWLFKDEVEMIEVGLHCVYACTLTDRWGLMASILSKLQQKIVKTRHAIGGSDDFIQKKGLERVLRNSHSTVPSNSKLTMSPLFLDEEDYSQLSVSGSNVVFDGQKKQDSILENLDKRLRLAEGHVESGRLLTHYQVAKPIGFFLKAHDDQKGVKQLLRLVLSKFGRRQPGRSDNEWATMWRDMQCFQEKAFPFLDTEYMLLEFCRGLLKAGKFSLARNYLKGTASTVLAPEKAEMLVIQAAREYFFSASSLDSSEIWKAKECLDLFPSSKQVKAEDDVIDAITVKLPRLGVTLLPVQFRQMRNPMEIIKMAITSETGAYLKAEEVIEVARLLGLNSPDDIAMVEEAIAREAGTTGDLQLAVDLCLLLVRKGHGPIWDLCAALGRGPDLDKLDLQSRKELLGFALSHCDDESVGELLYAWKEIDLASQCENLGNALGKKVPTLSDQEALIASFPMKSREEITDLIERSGGDPIDTLELVEDEELIFKILMDSLSNITKKFSEDKGFDWDALSRESKRFMSFATLQLPWLLELSRTAPIDPNSLPDIGLPVFTRECSSIYARATAVILYWLANNNTLPKDNLIANFAKTALEKPVSQENDMFGCSYLLNLSDPYLGVEVIDEAIRTREEYQEIQSATKIGLIYSSLQACVSEHLIPKQRRKLLLNKFWESQPTDSDGSDKQEEIKTTFWKEWSSRIEEQQKLADQARNLEQIIPGVETSRFLSGDTEYIRRVVFSLIESVKMEKKSVLLNGLIVADVYGVKRSEVLVRYLSSLLLSQLWTNEEIEAEISVHWNELLEHAAEVLKVLSSTVYSALYASNKQRLGLLYKILSAHYMHIKETSGPECTSSVGDTENPICLKNELLIFLTTMIAAGCSFRDIVQICFQGRESIMSDTSLKSADHIIHQNAVDKYEGKLTAIRGKDADSFQDIQEVYVCLTDSVFREIHSQVSNDLSIEINKLSTRRLCNLLSSLACISYGDDEVNAFDPRGRDFVILQRARHAVWSKLSMFADDMQLPNQVRVYALELLQCISGRGYTQAFGIQDNSLLPWDGWDAFHYLDLDNHSTENKSNVHGLKTTLVALKSTELISGLWQDVEVKGEDLVTIDSAVSLFCSLAAQAVSKPQLSALRFLLKEWEGLFENDNQRFEIKQMEETQKATGGQDDWSEVVEWDDGWEAFKEPKENIGEKPNRVASVHTFHICWMIILEQLIGQCQLEEVLQLLDETSSNKSTVLLSEDEVCKLTSMLANIQPVVALKSALLFPYDSLWFETLKIVEDKLKQTNIFGMKEHESIANGALDDMNNLDDFVDYELLSLILSMGLLPSLAGNPAFATIFSSICTTLGRLARLQQERHLCIQRNEDQACISRIYQPGPIFIGSVAFPYFIAELTRGKHYFLAGALVFQFMHVHTGLNSMNAVCFVLKTYLEMQVKEDEVKYQNSPSGMAFPHCLKNTVVGLKDKLPSVLKLAYSALSEDLG